MEITGKRILVTGADGFIGSHLTEMLVLKGARVRALVFYNSFNTWGWLEDVNCKKEIEIFTGDIRDPHFCMKLTADIDIIIHLAALIAIPYSYIAPDSYIDTNVKGTLNLCQAALESGCELFIHTSTSEVYGTAQYIPIDEKHPLQPQSPYSASKIGADMVAFSFYHSFNLPVIVARPFNTYGPRQSARAVVPTIITQLTVGKNEIRLGDLAPTRDFNYVSDTCEGYLALAACREAIGEVVNIGSNSETSIGDLFDLLKTLLKSDAVTSREEVRIRPEKSEVFRLRCDNSKLISLTGFKPHYTLEEGLINTIKWFLDKNNFSRYKPDIYNL